MTAAQGIAYFGCTPVFTPNPVKSEIIRIFDVIEKVQLLETVEGAFHLVFAGSLQEFDPQFASAI